MFVLLMSSVLRRLASAVAGASVARRHLAALAIRATAEACSECGEGLTVTGFPSVENEGSLRLGARVLLASDPAPTRLRVRRSGVLEIGDDCRIAPGCVLAASSRITLGDRVRLEPHVFAVDANVGDPDLDAPESPPLPITIGDDVQLGNRVTVLKGARIGAGAVVRAGSVVASAVPPGAVVSGNPAVIIEREAPRTMHDALFASVWANPERAAFVTSSSRTSYALLWDRASAIATRLAAAGAHPGARVLYITSSQLDFVASYFACSLAGCVSIPAPSAAARATVLDMIRLGKPSVLLGDRASLRELALPAEVGLPLVELDGIETVRSRLPRRPSPPNGTLEAPASILFTSGTTRKKAVSLSHRALIQSTTNINAFMLVDESIREFVMVPLHHSFGLGRVRAVLAVGGTLVVQDGPLNPAVVTQAVEREGCNALSSVPAGLAMFAGRYEDQLLRLGRQIRVVELGSAFMTPKQKAKLLDLFPLARVCMHYGLTEASRSSYLEFRSERAKLETVGRPSPNVALSIVDRDGSPCEVNQEGEVVIYGNHLMSGYFGDDELTREVLRPDGGLCTGDRGFLDADGYLHLLGRGDDLINKGGIKISPLEIEQAISDAFPGFECCVVGVPDPYGIAGELPVVAYAGHAEVSMNSLLAALAERIDRTKLPDRMVRVAEIPRTENGKPQRRLLRERLESAERLASRAT
jgi:long-chain acyl-CoA synthetase